MSILEPRHLHTRFVLRRREGEDETKLFDGSDGVCFACE